MVEYGAYRRTTPKDLVTHNDAVDYWISYVTKQAISHGVIPFFWDTGGVLDRRNNQVLDQRTIDVIYGELTVGLIDPSSDNVPWTSFSKLTVTIYT